MGPPSAAHAFLQSLADRMLVDHEVGVISANVLGDPNPAIADAEHDSAQPIDLATTCGHNAAGIACAVLHRVLAKLADRHQNRVPNDSNIIEVVDQRLQQRVGELIDLGQLVQASRPDDHFGVVLDKRLANAADVTPQAKGTKASARLPVLGLLDFDATLALLLAFQPERKPHREEGMQARQVASIQNHLVRAIEVGIELRGVAVIARPRPTWKSQLHGLHRMTTFGSNRPFRPEINPLANYRPRSASYSRHVLSTLC